VDKNAKKNLLAILLGIGLPIVILHFYNPSLAMQIFCWFAIILTVVVVFVQIFLKCLKK